MVSGHEIDAAGAQQSNIQVFYRVIIFFNFWPNRDLKVHTLYRSHFLKAHQNTRTSNETYCRRHLWDMCVTMNRFEFGVKDHLNTNQYPGL